MTIASETYKTIAVCDGVTVLFDYLFKILTSADMLVTLYDINTGTETELTLNTDYTVSGVGSESGGTITLINDYATTPPSSSYKIVMMRDMNYTQETDYTSYDDFPANDHESALDKLTMLVLQLKEKIDRGLFADITQTTSFEFPVSGNGYLYSTAGLLTLVDEITGIVDYPGSIDVGLDASKSASPSINDIYFATDTKKIYICYVSSTWTQTNLPNRKFTDLVDGFDYAGDSLELVQVNAGETGLTSLPFPTLPITNLIIKPNATYPAYQVDITATELNIQGISVSSFSKTVDITASGANGLDTGVEANQWYYLWAIAKTDGTYAGLISALSSSPTMPTGYTLKRLIGAVLNSAGDFVSFRQLGKKYKFDTFQSVSNNSSGDKTCVMPSISQIGMFEIYVEKSASTDQFAGIRSKDSSGDYFYGWCSDNQSSGYTYVECSTNTSQVITVIDSASTSTFTVKQVGFEITSIII